MRRRWRWRERGGPAARRGGRVSLCPEQWFPSAVAPNAALTPREAVSAEVLVPSRLGFADVNVASEIFILDGKKSGCYGQKLRIKPV